MIENFVEHIESSAETRAKMARAMGFTTPTLPDEIKRENYKSDDEYLDAATMATIRRQDPRYADTYRALSRQLESERAAKAQQEREEKFQETLKSTTLDDTERSAVEFQAQQRAQADLRNGRISSGQFSATVEKYRTELTQSAKQEKASRVIFNDELRRAMRR